VSYYGMAWHLIGGCRLRKEYRDFRSDRIRDLTETGQSFDGHSHISLQEYFKTMSQSHCGLIPVVVTFRKDSLRGRPLYGSIQQTDLGDRIRAEYMLDNMNWMARWLLMFGTGAEVESPDELKQMVSNLIEELRDHHMAQVNLKI
jgi:predicted DNA-binding transcriptional regulator YafY